MRSAHQLNEEPPETPPAPVSGWSAWTRCHLTHLQDFVRRMNVNHNFSFIDSGILAKVKKTARPGSLKRYAVFCCILCLRSIKGPSSLRRHLFRVHRAAMLIDWGAVAGYHGATAEQVRVLVEGVPEDDEMYVTVRKRFEKDKGVRNSAARRLDPRRSESLVISAAPPSRSSAPDYSVCSPPALFIHVVEISNPSSTAPSTVATPRPLESAGSVPEARPAFRRPTFTPRPQVPRLVGGTGPGLDKLLNEISRGILKFQGPKRSTNWMWLWTVPCREWTDLFAAPLHWHI